MQQNIQIRDLHFTSIITEAQAQTRVKDIGNQLSTRYAGRTPMFISILSGAFVFASDLIRSFQGECEIKFVKLSSYSGTESTGKIKSIIGLDAGIRGRDLIVVEDIVDTGRTLHFFLDQLKLEEPASICTVTFLRKPDAAEFPVPVDYVGFDIDNRFVVGYGLDYEELGRNLPGVYRLIEP
jgi:hypoxanthine phosphoribosyltransferase